MFGCADLNKVKYFCKVSIVAAPIIEALLVLRK